MLSYKPAIKLLPQHFISNEGIGLSLVNYSFPQIPKWKWIVDPYLLQDMPGIDNQGSMLPVRDGDLKTLWSTANFLKNTQDRPHNSLPGWEMRCIVQVQNLSNSNAVSNNQTYKHFYNNTLFIQTMALSLCKDCIGIFMKKIRWLWDHLILMVEFIYMENSIFIVRCLPSYQT